MIAISLAFKITFQDSCHICLNTERDRKQLGIEERQITKAAKLEIIVIPVLGEYSPEAKGRVGLLT